MGILGVVGVVHAKPRVGGRNWYEGGIAETNIVVETSETLIRGSKWSLRKILTPFRSM